MIFALVIVAAFFHAVWNSIVKSSSNRLAVMSLIQLTGMAIGLVAMPFAPFPHTDCYPYLIATTFVHLCYQLFLVKAYKIGELSQVYPIARGSGPLFVSVFSYFYGEHLSWISLCGVFLISLGIFYLAFYKQTGNKKAIFVALITGFLIAIYTVLDALGMRYSNSPFGYIALLHIAIGPPMVLVSGALIKNNLLVGLRTELIKGLVAGTLACVGYGIALWAAKQNTLAYIASLRETSVIFASIIGATFFKESFGKHRIVAAVVVACGMILIVCGR